MIKKMEENMIILSVLNLLSDVRFIPVKTKESSRGDYI